MKKKSKNVTLIGWMLVLAVLAVVVCWSIDRADLTAARDAMITKDAEIAKLRSQLQEITIAFCATDQGRFHPGICK